jgi:peroxiredoxin family protein
MFNVKKDTVYVAIILLVMFGAMLGGMSSKGLTVIFFVGWGLVWLHKRHTQKNQLEEENEAEVFRNELAHRLYEEGVDPADTVKTANKVTEAQFGKPIDELIEQDKYKK